VFVDARFWPTAPRAMFVDRAYKIPGDPPSIQPVFVTMGVGDSAFFADEAPFQVKARLAAYEARGFSYHVKRMARGTRVWRTG